jgi:hypothetical protein
MQYGKSVHTGKHDTNRKLERLERMQRILRWRNPNSNL